MINGGSPGAVLTVHWIVFGEMRWLCKTMDGPFSLFSQLKSKPALALWLWLSTVVTLDAGVCLFFASVPSVSRRVWEALETSTRKQTFSSGLTLGPRSTTLPFCVVVVV